MKKITKFINEKLILNNQTQVSNHSNNWTIEDAKNGDIITEIISKKGSNKAIYIFKNIDLTRNIIIIYCFYSFDKKIFRKPYYGYWCNAELYNNKYDYWLSTEAEKREFFNAMKNEGYKWDPNKKEVQKI